MRRLFAFTIAICLICVLFLAACTPKEKELLALNVETELANAGQARPYRGRCDPE